MPYEINDEMLSKLRSLDEKTLGQIISGFARATGMSDAKAAQAESNARLIKNRLNRMNSSEINRMLAGADENSVGEIINSIKNEK